MPNSFTIAYRLEITSLAAGHRLPAVYPYRSFAEVGGLVSLRRSFADNFRRAATSVDPIQGRETERAEGFDALTTEMRVTERLRIGAEW
jgi:hypothetical protein